MTPDALIARDSVAQPEAGGRTGALGGGQSSSRVHNTNQVHLYVWMLAV